MKSRILWISLIFFLCLFNFMIVQKEQLLASGKEIYLELVPVDPRSLLQGDYMTLRYRIATDAGLKTEGSEDGYIVTKLDANLVATFSRVASTNEPVAQNELKIKFRRRGSTVKIATDAFFFQNGQASVYSGARYGIVRVGDDGDVLLVGVARAPGERL